MLVRGTTTRSGTQIVEEADRLGGSIDAYGDFDYGEVAATALSRNWKPMLELVTDVALRPSMPDSTFQGGTKAPAAPDPAAAGTGPSTPASMLSSRASATNPYASDPNGQPRGASSELDHAALLDHYGDNTAESAPAGNERARHERPR